MSQTTPTVFVVDDDISIRESLELLIRCEGWQPAIYASASELLKCPLPRVPSCLILDMSLPDINGLEVQKHIATEYASMPIIFLTGHSDISMAVRAMKAGALEFLTKPFNHLALLAAIKHALERSRTFLGREMEFRAIKNRYASLTGRERQVMELVVSGRLNKQVGSELGISEITVKAHRGRVMEKMEAGSIAELVKIAGRLRLTRSFNAISALA